MLSLDDQLRADILARVSQRIALDNDDDNVFNDWASDAVSVWSIGRDGDTAIPVVIPYSLQTTAKKYGVAGAVEAKISSIVKEQGSVKIPFSSAISSFEDQSKVFDFRVVTREYDSSAGFVRKNGVTVALSGSSSAKVINTFKYKGDIVNVKFAAPAAGNYLYRFAQFRNNFLSKHDPFRMLDSRWKSRQFDNSTVGGGNTRSLSDLLLPISMGCSFQMFLTPAFGSLDVNGLYIPADLQFSPSQEVRDIIVGHIFILETNTFASFASIEKTLSDTVPPSFDMIFNSSNPLNASALRAVMEQNNSFSKVAGLLKIRDQISDMLGTTDLFSQGLWWFKGNDVIAFDKNAVNQEVNLGVPSIANNLEHVAGNPLRGCRLSTVLAICLCLNVPFAVYFKDYPYAFPRSILFTPELVRAWFDELMAKPEQVGMSLTMRNNDIGHLLLYRNEIVPEIFMGSSEAIALDSI